MAMRAITRLMKMIEVRVVSCRYTGPIVVGIKLIGTNTRNFVKLQVEGVIFEITSFKGTHLNSFKGAHLNTFVLKDRF